MEKRDGKAFRGRAKPEGERRTKHTLMKKEEGPGRVPEADSEAKQQPAPER